MKYSNEMTNSLSDVLTQAREMRFADKSDSDLQQMLIVCGNHAGQSSDVYTTTQISHAVKTVHEEISRRQRAKNHQEAIAEQQNLHQKATHQDSELHGETKEEMKKLKDSVDLVKSSVDQLARARTVDKWILIFGAIAALTGIVLIVIALKH
jgi:maltodextrin utilization protein YvdJ